MSCKGILDHSNHSESPKGSPIPPCPTCGLAPMFGLRIVAGHGAMTFARCPRGHHDVAGSTADAAEAAWRADVAKSPTTADGIPIVLGMVVGFDAKNFNAPVLSSRVIAVWRGASGVLVECEAGQLMAPADCRSTPFDEPASPPSVAKKGTV